MWYFFALQLSDELRVSPLEYGTWLYKGGLELHLQTL